MIVIIIQLFEILKIIFDNNVVSHSPVLCALISDTEKWYFTILKDIENNGY